MLTPCPCAHRWAASFGPLLSKSLRPKKFISPPASPSQATHQLLRVYQRSKKRRRSSCHLRVLTVPLVLLAKQRRLRRLFRVKSFCKLWCLPSTLLRGTSARTQSPSTTFSTRVSWSSAGAKVTCFCASSSVRCPKHRKPC